MYIGRGIDQIDNISTLDNLSFNGSDATFNLTQNSVAFVPVSADALQIQIDGVIQSGNYTVSGSTVTFDFTPSGSSVCNGIRHYGVGLLTTVSDSSITTAKLGADSVNGSKIADDSISDEHLDNTAITGQTAITSLADTDKFLVSDASDSGNLKYVEKQYLPSGSFNLIKTENVTSSTSIVNVTNCFSTTYDTYLVLIYRLLPATDGDDLRMRFLTGTSTEVNGSIYDYSSRYFDQDGSATSNTGDNQSKFVIADSIDSNTGNGAFNSTLWFNLDKNNSGGCAGTYNGTANYPDGSTRNHSVYLGGICQDTVGGTNPTGLKFFGGSGNIASVKISVYGVTK